MLYCILRGGLGLGLVCIYIYIYMIRTCWWGMHTRVPCLMKK